MLSKDLQQIGTESIIFGSEYLFSLFT